MNPLEHIPSAMLRPLPANATSEAKLRDKIDSLSRRLPGSVGQMAALLEQVKTTSDYDAAVNRVAGQVWSALESFYASGDTSVKAELLRFACGHLPEAAQAYIYRLPDEIYKVLTPPVSGAWLRRLGTFPFWRGEASLRDALEPIYV